jgi:cytochrome P450
MANAGPGRVEPFDPFLPAGSADPYPVYARLRAADPVHWGGAPGPKAPGGGAWYLTRYADVAAALTDPRLGRTPGATRRGAPPPAAPEAQRPYREMARRFVLFQDPPDHTRLRSLVVRAFTPAAAERLRPTIARTADALLAGVAGRPGMDLIADFAFPLPVTVIAALLGVPLADRGQLRAWSTAIAAAIDLRHSEDVMARASAAAVALTGLLRPLLRERRRRPRADLLSALVAVEAQGDRLSEDELLAMAVLLLVAGHETTVNLIGNGVLALLRHPDQRARLAREPALLAPAIEELLRYDSPVQMTFRTTHAVLEVGGQRLGAGQHVGLLLGAANRDPAQFPAPDRLDIGRTPNRHLAFGGGSHFCLGAGLARVEAQVAVATLLQRFPGLRLATEAPVWRPTITLRGLAALPVAF